jgi:curved DNA-binding protein CbpA
MTGGLVGCIAAGASWTFAAVYGVWQTAVGLYRTPATLMAQLQRKCYYNYTDGKWQHYNLTNHFAILSEFGGGRSRGIRVQDDSFYKLLQVSTDASQKDIKRAYYKLAKEYHPDKMSKDDDKEAVNERFLKLHRAYETLHDPQQRQQYNEFGSSSIESVVFDSDVFFDVLFGFSPELELYIGDLAIKSFAADLLHVVVAAQIGPNAGSINQEQMLNQLFSTFFLKSRDRRDMRQVEIALNLQDFIAPFVKGDIDMGSFSLRCAKEANNIAGSTSFPLFLKSVGKALYWQGRRTITSVVDLPTALMAWTREGVVGLETWTWPPIAVARLMRQTNNHVARATEWLENQSQQRYSDEEWQALHFKKIIEELLPSLMDFVWDYNGRDITDALDGACWKLLHTTTTLSTRERKRQAQALQELGSSFIKVAESWEYREPSTATNQDSDRGHNENDSRIKRAIEMAMKVRP